MDLLARSLGNLTFASSTAGTNAFGEAWNRLNLGRMGSQMQWLGRQIEYNFTLPLVAAGGAAMTFALQNEKAFTRIIKVYGDAGHGADFYAKEIKSLQRAFVELSDHFGVAQQDALNIAADWAAAGASGLALAKSVKLTMETMILGELDATKATKSLIAIQAQYGLSIDELTNAIEVLNMVENQTGASMGDLIDGFTRAAGVARSAGVSVEELAADIAALTPATGTAANAGNALKTIFSRLMSPTKEVNDALAYMGINFREISWQGANAQQKLIIMAKAFNDLSDSEKGFVASTIATRYQVNRFEVLMAELVNQSGYYSRAIQSTADKTAVFRQAQYELNQVLSSNPQRLKIIWTQLQNAATDIIQPLIPLLLYLAGAIRDIVSGFSDLNPATQKFVLTALALLAAVGPVVRYMGALQVLVFELSKILKVVVVPLWLLRNLLASISIIPIPQMLTATSVAVRAMGSAVAVGLGGIPFLMAGMWSRIQGIIVAGIMVLGPIWRGFTWLLTTNLRISLVTMTLMWKVFTLGLATLIGKSGRTVVLAYRGMLLAIQNALLAFAAWSGIMWRIITLTPVNFIKAMWGAIVSLFVAAIPTIRAVSIAIWTAMTGPWGIAIGIIIGLVVLFWDDIKQMWTNGVNWMRANAEAIGKAFRPLGVAAENVRLAVVRAFNALPDGIKNALLAVVRVVRAAVLKVYELFSYLNPWAHHSPSLVENVTTGVEEIIAQYARLTGVGSAFAQAADDLDIFAEATKRINRSAEANHYAEIRRDLLSLASDAVPAFDRLLTELYGLEDQLKVISKAVSAQEKVTDNLRAQLDLANAALDAQKDILQQMKDEANGYQEAIDKINGDLEVLTGTRKALRDAGAGSDILGQYDQQIQMLEDQKHAINDQLNAAETAYQQQKELVDQLTISRDALQASYDIENAKLKVLRDQYQEIADRIRDITSAINDFATAAAQLRGGGAGGGLSDVIPADYADVGGSGRLGREGGLADQSAEIDAFTKELADKTKNMFGLFDFLEPVKRAWGKVKGWLRENIQPIFSVVGDGISAVFSKLPNPFAKMDFGGFLETLKSVTSTVGKLFKSLWELIGPPLKQIRDIIGDALKRAFREIGPELAKFKDLVGPMGELLKMVWENAKPVVMIIGGALLLAIKVFVEILANVLGPILNWIIDIIKGVIKILRGLIEFIVGVFTGNWKLAWQGIKDFFGGIWDVIWSTIKNAGLLIWGIVKGFVEGIVGFFKWLWEQLVGHSIIPDIVNGILYWFNLMLNGVRFIIDLVKKVFQSLKDKFWEVVDGVKNLIDNLVSRFNDLRNRFSFSGLFDGIKTAFRSAINWIIEKWNNLEFRIGGGSVFGYTFPSATFSTPNLPYLAKGDIIDKPTLAMVGEGMRGYPEYVIPTDPAFRSRALRLFSKLGGDLGVGGSTSSRSTTRAANDGTTKVYNFYGDLKFPGVKSGSDVEEFLKNLESLIDD